MSSYDSSPKRRLLAQLAAVARALGHEHRLELLEQIAQGERSVELLADRLGLSIANTSQHLQSLRRSGLVTSRRDGKYILYRLRDDAVVKLMSALGRVAERSVAEVELLLISYFRSRDSLEPVTSEELMSRIRDGSVTILDVRPGDEFALGHLPGALNIPLTDIEQRLSDLPSHHEVVAYCRGPYCVLSFEAVAKLRRCGIRARRLEDGYPEWRAAGLPVEAGS